jgi:hypothetical protein
MRFPNIKYKNGADMFDLLVLRYIQIIERPYFGFGVDAGVGLACSCVLFIVFYLCLCSLFHSMMSGLWVGK